MIFEFTGCDGEGYGQKLQQMCCAGSNGAEQGGGIAYGEMVQEALYGSDAEGKVLGSSKSAMFSTPHKLV